MTFSSRIQVSFFRVRRSFYTVDFPFGNKLDLPRARGACARLVDEARYGATEAGWVTRKDSITRR